MKDKQLRKRLLEHGLWREDGIGYRVADVDHRLCDIERVLEGVAESLQALAEYLEIKFEVSPTAIKAVRVSKQKAT